MYNGNDIDKKVGADNMARKSRYPERNKLVLREDPGVKAGVYARLSLADKDDAVSESIKNQISLAHSYLEKHRNLVFVKSYVDDGYTGRNFNRPAFKAMLEDLKAGMINCVIVKDVSRIGRNHILVGDLLTHELPKMKARFISINDEYDSIDDEDGLPALDLILQTIFDEKVSNDISQKVSTAIAAKVQSGDFLPAAGSIPYGYMRDTENNTYKIDEDVFLVVRKMFTMRAENASISAITDYLNSQEIPSPGKLRYMRGLTTDERMKETQWTRATVRKILNDLSYIGHRVHGRKKKDAGNKKVTTSDSWTIIKNAHPAIIPEELFNTVQNVNEQELEKHSKQEKRAEVAVDYREALRGKLFCADCGKPMLAKKSAAKPGSKMASYIYYDCSSYYSDHKNCSSHYVREDAIITELTRVLNQYAEMILDPLYRKTNIDPYKVELRMIRREIFDIQAKKEALSSDFRSSYEEYVREKISAEEFKSLFALNKEKVDKLNMRKKELFIKMSELEQKVDALEGWIKTFKAYRKSANLSKEVVDSMVDKIMICNDSDVRIGLRFGEEIPVMR